MFQEPNWIVVTAVGALAGALVGRFGALLVLPFRRRPERRFLGGWHECHFTFREGELTLRRQLVTLRAHPFGGVRADFSEDDADGGERPILSYRGVMKTEGENVLLEVSGTSHGRSVVLRYLARYPSVDEFLPGVWMSQDLDHSPAAGATVMSRRRLADAEAGEALRAWTAVEPCALRVRRSPLHGDRHRTGRDRTGAPRE